MAQKRAWGRLWGWKFWMDQGIYKMIALVLRPSNK
jgi:hypothetical protein